MLVVTAAVIVLGLPHRASLSIIILAVFWILEGNYSEKFRIIKSNKIIWLFIGLFSLYPLSLLYTENMSNGLFNVEKHLAFLSLPLIILTSNIPSRYISYTKVSLVFASIAGITFCLLVALVDYLLTGEIMALVDENIINKFTYYGLTRAIEKWHPLYISMFLNFSWVFILNELISRWVSIRLIFKSLYIFIILYILVCVVLLNSLNGIFTMVALLLIIPTYLLLKKGRYKTLIFSLTVSFILLSAIIYTTDSIRIKLTDVFTDKLEATDNFKERNALTIRLAKWESGWEIIQANLWLGIGPGDTKSELIEVYNAKGFDYLAEQGYNAHNQYIEFLIAFGLAGFIIYMTLLILFFKESFRKNNLIIFSTVIVISLSGMTESILDRQHGIMLFSFLLPLLYYESRRSD